MANQTSRPYGSNPTYRQPAANNGGGDPLAELARLIGQTDPFGEHARDGRRGGVPTDRPHQDYAAPLAEQRSFAPPAQPQYAQPVAEQGFAAESYPQSYEQGGYPPQPGLPPQGYAAPGYYDDRGQQAGDEIYDDAPPNRRRVTIIAVAAVFALAVLGTASAVGYRALFGSSGSSPPPVVKADTSPVKIVPPASSDAASNKLINDRVSGAQGERVVSREEQPVDLRDRPPSAFPGAPAGQAAMAAPTSGTGVIGEPKKVRTVSIRPDAPQGTPDVPPVAPARATAAARPTAIPAANAAPAPAAARPVQAADADDPPPPAPAQRSTAARPAPAASNAPMSLNPNAQSGPSPVRPAAPMRTAAAPPAPRAATTASPAAAGGIAVQVSSQRSEADAQASYRALQAKFPAQLGSRQATIRRADLGDKGTFYRALVVVGSSDEAGTLCDALRAAGGQCLIQRN